VRHEDATAAAALVDIYESEEKWARLPPLYEVLLGAAEEDERKLELLQSLVEVTGHRLGDRAAAVEWAFKAYDLSPTENAARAARVGVARRQVVGFLRAGDRGASPEEEGGTSSERRRLRAKLARVQASELGRIDDAIGEYRSLWKRIPADEDAVAALDRLLRNEDRL